MSKENILLGEEMSVLDDTIPKHYKGYDMDILIDKMDNGEFLTDEEWKIIGEAQRVYHEKYFEKNRKKMEEEIKNEQYIMRHIGLHYERTEIKEQQDEVQ